MKRLLAIFLVCILILTGCSTVGEPLAMLQPNTDGVATEEMTQNSVVEDIPTPASSGDPSQKADAAENTPPTESIPVANDTPPESDQPVERELNFNGLNDPKLLQYVEDTVYSNLVETFASEDYIIENVHAVYISKEYLEEIAYNSQANIFFGYTLAELEDQFQGTKYIFALDENG